MLIIHTDIFLSNWKQEDFIIKSLILISLWKKKPQPCLLSCFQPVRTWSDQSVPFEEKASGYEQEVLLCNQLDFLEVKKSNWLVLNLTVHSIASGVFFVFFFVFFPSVIYVLLFWCTCKLYGMGMWNIPSRGSRLLHYVNTVVFTLAKVKLMKCLAILEFHHSTINFFLHL